MSRISAQSFLSLIQQSGLIEADRLKREVDTLEDQGHNIDEAATLAESLVERDLLTEWQAQKLLKGKHKGFTLGKYRLRRLLGKGGMSSVYLAEHILMRRKCAIKVLPIKRVDDTSYLARFHREARAVASLDHPNIVRAYDIDHEVEGDKEIHFLVMEYVDGESLHEQIKDKGPLSLDDAAEYFRQAALGLHNAHENGLVHRDVKPGNLLIDQSEVVKVLDLGLARFSEVSDDNPLTLAHDEKVLGTADYLAPEQAMDSHTADHRADIYGLGCTAYFALTGYPPFREGTLAQRLMFHQTKEPPAISEERPEVGESTRGQELVKIIQRMMAKKPDERFQTMDEVAVALARWLKNYADPAWRKTHPNAFMQSDASEPGGAVPIAKAVAVPIARPVKPVAPVAAAADPAATTIASSGDTQLQNSAAPAEQRSAPIVPPAVEPQPLEPAASGDQADPGFGAFLAGFDDEADSQPAAPAESEPPAMVAAHVDATSSSPPIVPIETGEASEAFNASPPTDQQRGDDAPSTLPVAPPVAATPVPAADVVSSEVVAPVQTGRPTANDQGSSVHAAPQDTSGSALKSEPVNPVSSEPVETPPAEIAPPETQYSDVTSADVGAPSAQPLPDFDPSILPAPISDDDDEYPSLLGGTPTAQPVAGFDDPGEVTLDAVKPASEFAPPVEVPAEPVMDPTLLNPVEPGSSSGENVDLAQPAFPVAPAEPLPLEPLVGDAPQFPSAPAIESPPAASFTPAPATGTPVPAAPAEPVFPGAEAAPAPVPDPSAPAPMFAEPVQPGVPVAQPQPGFPAEQPFAPQAQPAFPGEPPAFGAPPAGSGQYAAPGNVPAARAAKKKPPIAIIAGSVLALAVAVGAYFAFTGDDAAKPKSKKTASGSSTSSDSGGSSAGSASSKTASGGGGKILGPLVKVGPGGDFSTIGAALDYLKKNKSRYDTGSRRTSCKVEVNGGETYSEAIVVDNSGSAYPPGIQIVSSGVGRAKLAPSGSGPAIRLVGIENWLIQGFDVDASGKETAIEMSGYLNRTSLKELNVSGFSKAGVALNGAVGFSNDEVILDKLDLRGDGKTTAGIHLTSGKDGTSRIKVLNCRLFGPQESGILFESDVTYVEMRENIIADADIGISFSGGPLTLKDVQILNTTFYKCSTGGIVLDHMPTPAGGLSGSGGLAIHRNLFAQVNGPELLIKNDFDDKKFDQYFSAAGGGVEQNWSDRSQPADIKAGQREIVGRSNQRVSSFQFSSTDDSSPDFLTIKAGTPYARVGVPKLSTKPYIGARPAK